MKCSVKAEAYYCSWEPVASNRGEYHPTRPNWHLVLEPGGSGTGCGTLLEGLEEENFLYVL